jgi:hypothetical protein
MPCKLHNLVSNYCQLNTESVVSVSVHNQNYYQYSFTRFCCHVSVSCQCKSSRVNSETEMSTHRHVYISDTGYPAAVHVTDSVPGCIVVVVAAYWDWPVAMVSALAFSWFVCHGVCQRRRLPSGIKLMLIHLRKLLAIHLIKDAYRALLFGLP